MFANDTHANGATTTPASGPSNGTLSLNADGSFTYEHDGSETTGDSFTYDVCHDADCDTATVDITINPINDAPVAVDDGYSVEQGDTLTVDATSGVLANDTDAEDDILTAMLDSGPSNGTLALSDDGSFEYTPDGGFDGNDSFTYEVCDDGDPSECASATVNIAVSPPGEMRKGFVGLISGFATSTVGTSTVVTEVTLNKNGTNELIDINIGSDVQVKLPGGRNAWGSLEEAIAAGAEVVILSREGEDGNDAIFVLVKPKRPSHVLLNGTVIGTEDGVITLALPNGKTKKVRKPKGDEDPEDGEVLTVIVENTGDGEDDGEDGDGEVAEATGLVKASQVAERIQSFLEKLAANDANLPQAAIDARQRLVANLAVVLERHSAQHVSILEKVSKAQGLGSGTAAGIQRALEKAQAGQAKGNAIAADAKSKVGLGQNAGKGPKNIFGPSNSGDGSDDDDDDSGGSGKPDGAGKPADAGSQGSKEGNKGNSGD